MKTVSAVLQRFPVGEAERSMEMKTGSLSRVWVLLLLVGALAMLNIGCPNPMRPASSALSLGSITGRVLAQEQTDSGGITVTAELTDGIRSVSIQKLLSGAGEAGRAIAAHATTDASGEYVLTGLPPGTYTLNASSKDALECAVVTTVKVCAGSAVEAPLLRLTRTGEIAGTVTLRDETNHLGIVVFIAGTSYSAMTAANGAYTMSFVPAGKGYTLVATRAGYDSAITNVDVSTGRMTQVGPLVLAPHVTPPTTGSVLGTAHLQGAATSAGVFVYLAGTSHISVTDDAGSFTLTGVAPGNYILVASKEGYSAASCSVSVVAGIDLSAGELTLAPLGPFFVAYNANGAEGGNVPTDATGYQQGNIVAVLGNSGNLVKTGFRFAGWNTQADGNGTTYIQGQAFSMGSADVTLYASWTFVPIPISVAGYWNLSIVLNDQAMPPIQCCISQDGTTLKCGFMGLTPLSGSIDGSNFTIAGPVPGAYVTFTGTVSGNQITGAVNSPEMGQGTFSMVPLTLPFGHLDIQGSCAGVPISINTEYALGAKPETMSFYRLSFDLNLNGSIADVLFVSSELSVKTFTVVTEEPSNQPGLIAVTVRQNGTEHKASGGVVNITNCSSAGADGHFDLNFAGGSNLAGDFHFVFGSSDGTISVVGSWLGSPVQAPAPVPASSWMDVNTSAWCNITFWDNQLSLWLGLAVAGDHLEVGDYAMPYAAWVDVMLSRPNEPQITIMDTSGGSLHITRYGPGGIAGSVYATFSTGDAISGSFDVHF
jgi:uncharacterized repeat protein (TIGR02543 family)